jgi:hypothetical protein
MLRTLVSTTQGAIGYVLLEEIAMAGLEAAWKKAVGGKGRDGELVPMAWISVTGSTIEPEVRVTASPEDMATRPGACCARRVQNELGRSEAYKAVPSIEAVGC